MMVYPFAAVHVAGVFFLALAAKITANTSNFLIRWISKLF